MINVISRNELAQVWYVYNGLVEVDGPFGTRQEAYEAARTHETRTEHPHHVDSFKDKP